MGSFDVPLDDERTQLDAFVEEYRSAIEVTLDGLTEEQVRRYPENSNDYFFWGEMESLVA